MKIKKNQQDTVSLFEKFAGQLAAVLPKQTQPFFISLLLGAYTRHREAANRHTMAPRGTDQRRLSTSILPYPQHRVQEG